MNTFKPGSTRQKRLVYLKVAVVLLLLLFLSTRSADWWLGEGRGDWTLDLHGGYTISKINSREILLVYKENPDDSGGDIFLPNYFVTAYQLHEPYICLEGIATQESCVSQEELDGMALSYYLVDTSCGEVSERFGSHSELADHCGSLGVEITDEWIKPNKR